MTEPVIFGIYGILPADVAEAELVRLAREALAGGVRALQLRDKKLDDEQRRKRARLLRKLTRDEGALLIVNDRVRLALEVEADGVHLGREDLDRSVAALKAELAASGSRLIVGISCRADAAFARQVLAEGADYLSFGAVFPSRTKPESPVMGLARLAKARRMFPGATICAIGGIGLESLPAVRKAGADAAAVSSALFDAPDVRRRAAEMVAAWAEESGG